LGTEGADEADAEVPRRKTAERFGRLLLGDASLADDRDDAGGLERLRQDVLGPSGG
jgi:hypothetical protein